MSEAIPIILLAGVVVIVTSVARRWCERAGIEPLVGFILAGLLLGIADQPLHWLGDEVRHDLELLGQLGVIVLLFKVGLESNITGLLAQFRRALFIWLGNVLLAAVFGFATARYLLGFALVPSLFTAVALSATSVGVSTAIWQRAGRLDSPDGALIIDVAELDDISAIVLVALLFTAAPLLAQGANGDLAATLSVAVILMSVKLVLFAAGCYLFARYLERGFTASFRNDSLPSAAIAVATTGMACVIAGLASSLGFSIAIGALFAGLAFSRDPAEFEIDRQIEPVHALLSPFFFVSIGLSFEIGSAFDALAVGAVLLVAALAGKLLGAGLPAAALLGRRRGLLIGISMVPRAEIAMVVMLQGARLGSEYVPLPLLGGMSLVAMATTLLVPLALVPLLRSPRTAGQV